MKTISPVATLLLLLTPSGTYAYQQDNADDNGEEHFVRGVHAYQNGDLQGAHDAFAACLEVSSTRTDCMTNLASVLIDLGQEQAGEELYNAVLAVEPEHMDAAYNLALILQERRGEPASIDRAVRLYKMVVVAEPSRWDAWANLASAASESRSVNTLLAAHAYQRAIVELERSHEQAGDEPPEYEVEILSKMYYGLGMQLSKFNAKECAAFAADGESLLMGVGADGNAEDGTAITDTTICVDNALNALRTAVELDPDNAQAEHMLASMMAQASSGQGGQGGASSVSKASAGYVKALFDDFSDSFDEKLAALSYQVPQLLGEATAAYVKQRRQGTPFRHALDAGCGTGLAGPYLRPLVRGFLTGVDLSDKMLQKAKSLTTTGGMGSKPIFDRLLAKDLLELSRSDVLPKYDPLDKTDSPAYGVELITAADVLVYFGELGPLLKVFAALSQASSTLIFSCERVTEDEDAPQGWLLRPSGRFAHSKEYVVRKAATMGGYFLVDYAEIVPRMEYGKPIQGHLFVFARAQATG